MWVAFAYSNCDSYGNSNCNADPYGDRSATGDAHATAASHTSASAISAGVRQTGLFGDSRSNSPVPVTRTSPAQIRTSVKDPGAKPN